MQISHLHERLSKEYPFIELDFDTGLQTLALKGIVSSKRFDMGYAWDLYLKIEDDKIVKKTYKLRTYDNVRADFSKELEPPNNIQKKAEKIINLLQLKENLL